jgi:hypothetical protein
VDETPEFDIFQYFSKANRQCDRLREVLSNHNKTAIYVPGRLINSLYLLRKVVQVDKVIFVDDNPDLKKRFFPAFVSPVVSFDELVESRPDCVIVGSRAFGTRIEARVRSALKAHIVRAEELVG